LVIRINEAVETIVDVVDCKEELKANTLRAANAWVLEVGRLEYYGQEAAFRARFVFNDREVYLQLNEAWLESAVEARPMGVRTSSLLLDRTAVPKYPKALRGSGEEGVCLLHIELTKSGKPELIEPLSCPEAFQAEAIKAAKRWRWHPPHSNGEKVRSEANIRMRFKAQ
jgi:TonB family protein